MSIARLILDATVGKWKLMHEGREIASSTAKYYLRQKVKQGCFRELGIMDCVDVESDNVVTSANNLIGATTTEDKFSINERFDFVYQCVKAAGTKDLSSVILTGEGGLGKTHTVMKALHAVGLKNVQDLIDATDPSETQDAVIDVDLSAASYCMVKGYCSAKGLYNLLYENRNRVIVFDDCDKVLRDPIAVDLLKSALDTYDERWVTWNVDASFDDDIPRTFRFYGSVVFITNKPLSSIDQAIRTRSVCIDLTMNTDQIVERMSFISTSSEFLPETSLEDKRECMALIGELKERIRGLSLRTLVIVINLKESCEDWKRVAEYVICR